MYTGFTVYILWKVLNGKSITNYETNRQENKSEFLQIKYHDNLFSVFYSKLPHIFKGWPQKQHKAATLIHLTENKLKIIQLKKLTHQIIKQTITHCFDTLLYSQLVSMLGKENAF